MRSDCCGLSFDNSHLFGIELINKTIYKMKNIDIEGLSVEHLSYSHPSLLFILSKFFRLIFCCYVYLLVLERVILFQYLSQRTADLSP